MQLVNRKTVTRVSALILVLMLILAGLAGSGLMLLFRDPMKRRHKQMQEAEEIMRMLCESGWLLPAREGMSATTLIMKYR